MHLFVTDFQQSFSEIIVKSEGFKNRVKQLYEIFAKIVKSF